MTYRENNVEWLDSVSLTSIIDVGIGNGGSGCVSRIWQSQYGTLGMSQYNIMWCYMLSTLTIDNIKKKSLRHCHIDFIALKEIIRGWVGWGVGWVWGWGGVVIHKWHSLYGWLGVRKTYFSALAMSFLHKPIDIITCLGLVSNNQEICGALFLICENAVLINMTDRG